MAPTIKSGSSTKVSSSRSPAGYVSSTRAPPPLVTRRSSQLAIEKPSLLRRASSAAKEDNSQTVAHKREALSDESDATLDTKSHSLRRAKGWMRVRGRPTATPPDAIEVRMSKHHGDSLGLTLSQPGGRGHVIVSRLTPTVANASLRGQLMQGSAIYEIATSQTGGAFTPVLDVHEVATMLREADGTIMLKISKSAEVPDGWMELSDEKRTTYYLHREHQLKTYFHPAALGTRPHAPEVISDVESTGRYA